MKKISALFLGFVLGLFVLYPHIAKAQSQRNPCYYTTQNPGPGNGCIPISAATPMPVTAAANSPVTVTINGPTPLPVAISGNTGITQIQGNATGTTGAVVGTLAAAAGITTFLCDFDVTALGTASVGPIVIAGLLGGSKTYQLTAGGTIPLSKSFNPCLPASAINTAITITTTADATASAVDVNSSGYQK